MKSPAFQFYVTDYLGSQRVQLLTLEQEGAYIRLLSYCWQHGSIPSNHKEIATLVGKGCSTTLARVVARMFEPCPDDPSKLIHDRLEDERKKQEAWKAKCSEGGKKSAELRKSAPRVVEEYLQDPCRIPFPSPSPKEERKSVPSLAVFEFARAELNKMFQRNGRAWSNEEEFMLAEICKSPDVKNEVSILVNLREKMPADDRRFFPQSVPGLLRKWGQMLDTAAIYQRPQSPEQRKAIEAALKRWS